MRRGRPRGLAPLAALTLLAAAPQAARAQRIAEPRENPLVEIAKWSAGGLALAAGAFAFVVQDDAEDR